MGRGRVAWHDGRPAGVLGYYEPWPGQWEAVAFGTDAFRHVGTQLGRYGLKEMRAILRDVGARRLQADSHADNADGHRFIKALGGQQESVLRAYGKDGANYYRFVWLAERDAKPILKVA